MNVNWTRIALLGLGKRKAAGHPADAPLRSAAGAESAAAVGEATPLSLGPVEPMARIDGILIEVRAAQRFACEDCSWRTHDSISKVERALVTLRETLASETQIGPRLSAEPS